MMGINSQSKKEACSVCSKNILIGHPSIVCSSCDRIYHSKCSKNKNFKTFRNKLFCLSCIKIHDIIRYNPFYDLLEEQNENFFEDEPVEYIESIQELSEILENCKNYSKIEFKDTLNYLEKEKSAGNFIFSTYFQNVDGNATNFDHLSSELKSLKHEFSVIGIAETNILKSNKDLYKINDNYTSVYSSKIEDKSKGSGLGLYVRNDLNFSEMNEFSICNENIESIFVEITCSNIPITVGVLYRPPSGDLRLFNIELEVIISKLSDKNCYILGDYNVNLLNLNTKSQQDFEEIVISNGYCPCISISTHQQSGCEKTCIDNIITNQAPQNIHISGKISGQTSKHSGIFQISKLPLTSNPKKGVAKIKIEYDYNRNNLQNFIDTLAEQLETTENTDECFEEFSKVFHSALDKTCKLETPKTTKRNCINNPWITAGIIESITTNDEHYNNWIGSLKKLPDVDPSLETKHKTHQKILRWLIKKSKNYAVKIDKFKGNKKKTWKIINEIRGKGKQDIKASFIIDNEHIVCRRAIADKFNKYFASIASKLNIDAYSEVPITSFPSFESYMSRSSESSIFLEDCDEAEVSNIILELQNGKASDIPIIVIKAARIVISPYLSKLYNIGIASGIFPDVLKTSKITPIYKKGNKELIENYRPVSTLPIFGKIFEKIIYSRLYKFLTQKGMISDSQFGFRKNHSTGHAIHHSVNIIKKGLQSKKHILGIFIDLSKAFDTLDHELLLRKLGNCGIRGISNDLLRSYLSNRKQFTYVLGEKSAIEPVLFGVPQGSVLGPLLFLLYINDIINCFTDNDIKLVLYADDTNIFITGDSRQNLIEKANNVLIKVNKFMKSNLLHINLGKCCFMHFNPTTKCNTTNEEDENLDEHSINNEHQQDEEILKINETPIPEVSSTKFLGVTIDNRLSWIPHINHLHKKLKSATGMLKRMRDNIPEEHYKPLYYALFESHMTYCITVFGTVSKTCSEKLFKIQKHCIRILFGDLEKYLDKFKTSARTRPFETQRLGAEFFCKEHTKPLFNKLAILAFQNLFNYQICLETLKTLKSRTPQSLFQLYVVSTRNNQLYLRARADETPYIKSRVNIWNNCIKLIARSETLTTIKISKFKKDLKKTLLKIQNAFNSVEWYPDLNFTLR